MTWTCCIIVCCLFNKTAWRSQRIAESGQISLFLCTCSYIVSCYMLSIYMQCYTMQCPDPNHFFTILFLFLSRPGTLPIEPWQEDLLKWLLRSNFAWQIIVLHAPVSIFSVWFSARVPYSGKKHDLRLECIFSLQCFLLAIGQSSHGICGDSCVMQTYCSWRECRWCYLSCFCKGSWWGCRYIYI